MDSAILSLLSAFLLSILGLFVFIWSLRKGLLVENPAAASVIFARGEIGRIDDPALADAAQRSMQQAAAEPGHAVQAADKAELQDRVAADASTAFPVFMFVAFACFWLLIGSLAGLTSSIKLHQPDWLTQQAWLTFGRIRTVHLTAVLYGWITNAALGMILWLLPRLLRTRLHGAVWTMLGGALINTGIAAGIGAVSAGLVGRHGIPRDSLADRNLRPGGFRHGHSARAVHAGEPQGRTPVRQRLVPGRGPAVDRAAVPGRQAAGRAHRRAAGHHQLVVRPQRAGPVVHAGERRGHLLLPAQDHRSAGALVQPVDPGLLDASLLLRPGRRPSPDRRPGARLAHNAVHRAEPDDGDSGDRVQHQHGRHPSGPHAPGALSRPRCAS